MRHKTSKQEASDSNKLQSDATALKAEAESELRWGCDSVPAGCMVEGISRVRYVIAVSRLIPHGASLVPDDDSSVTVKCRRRFFLLSISSAVESDTGCWESLISDSSLLSWVAPWGENKRWWWVWERGDYWEDEVRKWVKGLSPNREGMMSGESSLVWFTHLEMKSAPAVPSWQRNNYSAESQTTAPGEVWHHRLLL